MRLRSSWISLRMLVNLQAQAEGDGKRPQGLGPLVPDEGDMQGEQLAQQVSHRAGHVIAITVQVLHRGDQDLPGTAASWLLAGEIDHAQAHLVHAARNGFDGRFREFRKLRAGSNGNGIPAGDPSVSEPPIPVAQGRRGSESRRALRSQAAPGGNRPRKDSRQADFVAFAPARCRLPGYRPCGRTGRPAGPGGAGRWEGPGC